MLLVSFRMLSMRWIGVLIVGVLALANVGPAAHVPPQAGARPHILLAIADDWSWLHAGVYGDEAVSTPNIDRLAREGVRFTHAFAAAPSCTPSRNALLTGQYPHRLDEGSQLWSILPTRFPIYPELLGAADYHVGSTRKGWGPGSLEASGRAYDPAGPKFADANVFLDKRPGDAPFVFWFGSQDPHRPYDTGSGVAAGIDLARVSVPPFLPDTPEVRSDIADYLFEVQRFDRELGEIVERLERDGLLDRTIVIVTADNGMPFPRAKATVYDGGTRVPLVIRWPGQARAGLVSDAMVNLIDLAPTMLEVAGLPVPQVMSGRSLLPVLRGEHDPARDRVYLQRERHANVRRGDLSYPVRAVRTHDHLYIRNFRPDRWPAGDPQLYFAVGPYGDIDDGPSKQVVLQRRDEPAIASFAALALDKRPAEELYVLADDPHQLRNVAADPRYVDVLARLRADLETWQRETADARLTNDDDRWDRYPYYGGPAKP